MGFNSGFKGLKCPLEALTSQKVRNLNIDTLEPPGIATAQFGGTKSSLKGHPL